MVKKLATSVMLLFTQALGALGGCTDNRPMLEVSLQGVPADATSLSILPIVAGHRLSPQPLSDAPSFFRVELPRDSNGTVDLQVSGLSSNTCAVAAGSASRDISGSGRYPLDIQLVPAPGCVLDISPGAFLSSGGGLVTVDPGGTSCRPPCQVALRDRLVEGDRRVTLRALEDPDSFFFGWPGAPLCRDPGSCSIELDPGVTRITTAFVKRRVCITQGFCWENPLPQGNAITGLSATSGHDVWAVGGVGTLLHWDGSFWGTLATPSGLTLYGVMALAKDDVWAVGDQGTVLHFDGSAIQTVPCPTHSVLRGVWGNRKDNVWMVGDQGSVLHWDGSTLQPVSAPNKGTLSAVWGSGDNDVWAAGAGILHWDGEGLSLQKFRPRQGVILQGLWGSGPADVWAVGATGGAGPDQQVLHFDGGAWVEVAAAPSIGGLWTVVGLAQGGKTRHLYAGGMNGGLLHLDLTQDPVGTWTESGAGRAWVRGLWAGETDDVWAAGEGGTLIHGDGVNYFPYTGDGRANLNAVWSSGPGDIWAVGGGVLHWNGAFWVQEDQPTGTLWDVFGMGPDVWAVGNGGAVIRLRGELGAQLGRQETHLGSALFGMWGNARNNLWIVGAAGTILHFDGNQFTPVKTAITDNLWRIWGSGPSGQEDLWAIGFGTTDQTNDSSIWHYHDGAWSLAHTVAGARLWDLGGSGPDDVWFAGENRTLLHFHGGAFSDEGAVFDKDAVLRSVWVNGDLWISGFDPHGTLFAQRGAGSGSWQINYLPVEDLINAIHGAGQDLIAVGQAGIVLRRTGSTP